MARRDERTRSGGARRRARRGARLVAWLAASGCATAPAPAPAPALVGAAPSPAPAAARAAPVESGPRSAWPTGGATRPLVLDLTGLLERIAAANPSLEMARSRLERARAARREVGAERWPQLTLGLDFARTNEPARAFGLLLNQHQLDLGPGFDPTPGVLSNWREQVQLDWALLAPDRRARARSAEEGEEAARLESEALERRLLNAGVQAWIGLRASRALERVARESVAVVERRLELTSRRAGEGAALRADVLRLEVRLAQARQEEAALALAAREAESSLRVLLGEEGDAPLVLADEQVAIGPRLPTELDELLDLAQRERLDLAAAAKRARAGAHGADAARAAWLPRLSLFASYQLDGEDLGLHEELDSYALGLGLRLPLSAGTGARVDGAVAAERESKAALRALALEVAREVRDAREALLVAERTLALASASVGAAEEAYRIVAQAQDAGAATVTDALEAQDAREQAAVRAVAARAGLELARARLVAATGGVR